MEMARLNITDSERVRLTRRVTYAGMAVNIAIAAAKALGGIMFSSCALMADAVHSASDLVTDLAVIFGVRYWVAPADEDHPYGHGKIEALVTVFISAALALVAIELGADAVKSLASGAGREPPGAPAFIIAVAGIVIKEALFHWTRAVAWRVGSTALEANAWHHRSDAISSIPVAAALAIARLVPKLWWLDAVGALVVGAFVLYVAWSLAKTSLLELSDADVGAKAADVKAVAEKVPGVRGVHKARARRYGGSFQADLHVQVDGALSVAEGHAIGHAVKEAILAAGLDVDDAVIHVEPDEPCGGDAPYSS